MIDVRCPTVTCMGCNEVFDYWPDFEAHMVEKGRVTYASVQEALQQIIDDAVSQIPINDDHVHEHCECADCEALRRIYPPGRGSAIDVSE